MQIELYSSILSFVSNYFNLFTQCKHCLLKTLSGGDHSESQGRYKLHNTVNVFWTIAIVWNQLLLGLYIHSFEHNNFIFQLLKNLIKHCKAGNCVTMLLRFEPLNQSAKNIFLQVQQLRNESAKIMRAEKNTIFIFYS